MTKIKKANQINYLQHSLNQHHPNYLYPMNTDLTNKRAIVCGSTQGIGLAVARELAGLNASVTLIARNETTLKSVSETLPQNARIKIQKLERIIHE